MGRKSRKLGDKPKMQTRMDEFAANQFPEEQNKKLIFMGGSKKEDVQEKLAIDKGQWEERDKEIQEYNNNITTLDEEYASFEPYKYTIVRALAKEYEKSDSGIIISEPKVFIPVKTANGMGNLEPIASPWAFQNLAVIVSNPEGFEKYKPGDIVMIPWGIIMPSPRQKYEGDTYMMPHAFTSHSYKQIEPPKSVSDRHFGYFIIDPYNDIIGKPKLV